MSLLNKAMKAKLTIGAWPAFTKDFKATKKTHQDFGASSDAGSYNKRLIAKSAMDKVNSTVSRLRTKHFQLTMPWGDDGWRLLPSEVYLEYTQTMRQLRTEFETAVAEFLLNYPALQAAAQQRLGRMYDADDYPSVDKLRSRFHFSMKIDPIESAGDFRVELSETEVLKIKAEIERRSREREANAMKDLWDRLYEVIERMSERLSDEDKKFRDSLVKNILNLTDLLPKMNVTGDQELNDLADQAREKLCTYTPTELRSNKQARKETADAAKQLMDTMDAMAGYMPKQAA
jgi:hypothetical protein